MSNYDPSALTPFTEGQKNIVHWTSVSMSFAEGTDTTSFDKYRQGIELTQPRHYFEGLVKIHSGEENHVVHQSTFGQSKIRMTPYPRWEENDSFNPVSYVQFDHVIDQTTLLRVYNNTFPIIVGDIDRWEFLNGDGALEPFTIRGKAANYSVEIPFFVHDIKAAFEEGNLNYQFASDQIVNKFIPKDENSETNYFDSVDTSAGAGPLVGYVSPEVSHQAPFNDTKQKTGIKISTNMDSTIRDALLDMNPPEDAYLTSDTVAMTSGFVVDFGRQATDSIAFGGMSASPIQISQEVEI